MADVEERLPQADHPLSFVTVEFDRETQIERSLQALEREPTSTDLQDRISTEPDHLSFMQSDKEVQRSLQELAREPSPSEPRDRTSKELVYQSSIQSVSGREVPLAREPSPATSRDRTAPELDHVQGPDAVCCSSVKFAPARQWPFTVDRWADWG